MTINEYIFILKTNKNCSRFAEKHEIMDIFLPVNNYYYGYLLVTLIMFYVLQYQLLCDR